MYVLTKNNLQLDIDTIVQQNQPAICADLKRLLVGTSVKLVRKLLTLMPVSGYSSRLFLYLIPMYYIRGYWETH